MSLIENLEKNSLVENTKGGLYYATSYNANLNLFAGLTRYNRSEEIVACFNAALKENNDVALANLLYVLDIRNGKGERRLFKTMFKNLCKTKKEQALRVLPFVATLGRFDYVLEGLNTPVEDDVIALIKKQLDSDMNCDNPSLLGKWLPSHRTHNKKKDVASYLMTKLGMNEKEYRKTLASLRSKIAIVEKKLTNRDYAAIEFESVPTKAMLKYRKAFARNMADELNAYYEDVKTGNKTINTTGLFCYEIIRNIINNRATKEEAELYDLMWKNQKDVVGDNNKNILVMADTSGSMTCCGGLPIANSIGLALYTAEHNNGYFKDYFMTFSSKPLLQKVSGDNIVDKVNNIKPIIESTNIDAAFELLLKCAEEDCISKEEMPEEIIIISDMEFDSGVYSKNGTNFNGWKKAFKEAGYILPKIVYWNVAAVTRGLPVCKHDNDCLMISGFSTALLGSLLNVTEFKPVDAMMEILTPYIEMLGAK